MKTKLGYYKHYKKKYYKVIGTARHSETGEGFVVYLPLYGDKQLSVRPEGMFNEVVYESAKSRILVQRFQFISNNWLVYILHKLFTR